VELSEGVPELAFEVDTFDDLVARGDALVAWLEEARTRFFEPMLAELRPLAAGSGGRRSAWGGAGGYWIGLHAHPPKGVSTGSIGYTERRWQRALDKVRKGEAGRVELLCKALDDWAVPSGALGGFGIAVSLNEMTTEVAIGTLGIFASRTFLGPRVSHSIQQQWVDFAKRTAADFNAAYGYITIDHLGHETPYEQFVGRFFGRGLAECKTFARGYFWGNFLSEFHLERLGGLQRVMAEAPCDVAEELPARTGLAYLQATPDIEDLPDRRLRELKDFLAPVLPSGPQGFEYRGPKLRVV
jgi:hypothetical protein